jgi:DNA modification methylase
MSKAKIIIGDVRTAMQSIPDQSVQTCVTSPPYWGLRDYGEGDQIGLEETPEQYVDQMVQVFKEVWRVLKDDGTLWLNIGDSYAGNMSRASNNGRAGFGSEREGVFSRMPDGLKPKDLVGIPWRLAFALQADGWYLRQDIIWAKPNPMPESVTDRCTKSHEYVFLMSKSRQYFYDHEAIKEPSIRSGESQVFGGNKGAKSVFDKDDPNFRNGSEQWGRTVVTNETRNKRDVWTVATKPYKGAHFAVMPEALVEPCILAGSAAGDTVLDPFTGSGTVGMVALRHNRNFVGTELNPEYAELAVNRIYNDAPLLNEIEKELAMGRLFHLRPLA